MKKKKYLNIVLSYPRRSKIQPTTTVYACPHCGNDDSNSIVRLRHGFNECERCNKTYQTSECFNED